MGDKMTKADKLVCDIATLGIGAIAKKANKPLGSAFDWYIG